MKFPILFVLLALGLISTPDAICLAADSVAAPDATANLPAYAPVLLPGQGLAQHDFVYSGEAKDERLFIVRVGRIVWSYAHSGRGEISDAVLQTNGNLLFAHQFGITEVTPDKRVVWNYDAPAGTEIHTAQPYGTNSVFFIQNGNPAKFILLNKTTGRIERQFELPSKKPNSVHRQFRRARLTPAGTILIAHLDLGKIAEYDWNGRVLWSYDLTNCWSAEPLANGNILAATSAAQIVREINRSGATVWEWTPADAPGYKFSFTQTATRLADGNTLINNWFERLPAGLDSDSAPVQAIEVTPDKRIVWALRSWVPPVDLGQATTIQILGHAPPPGP